MRWIPFYFLLIKEIRRFLRVAGQTLFTPAMTAALYLVIFGVSIGTLMPLQQGIPYLLFLVPGLVMMGIVNNAFMNSTSSLVISKYHGDLEDLRVTPLSLHHIVWAYTLGSAVRGALVGLSILCIGEGVYYLQEGALFSISHPLWMGFFIFAGGVCFGQLGLLVGLFAKSFDQVSAFSTFVLLPLIYLGGVFFSLENLHPFWRALSQWNPLFYFMNGIRYSVFAKSDISLQKSMLFILITCGMTTILAYGSAWKGSYKRY